MTHILEANLQNLIAWLTVNPRWALIITFLISFSESLAIIGSIIPGSVTMTAIGILAGSGVMRIDFTLIAAILGAIAGDSMSYTLGLLFKESIAKLWPFNTHKQWLYNGQDFFTKHGAISVLLGRFIGPLRSIIPLIAGMMRMNQMQFLIANVISAIAWSLLYVGPGILIGAASAELSKEVATHLFVITLGILVISWLGFITIKWLYLKVSKFLNIYLHNLWSYLQNASYTKNLCSRITPNNETQHSQTAGLCITFCALLILLTLVLVIPIIKQTMLYSLDYPLLSAIRSFHTRLFDMFFISMNIITSIIPLITIITTTIIYAGFYQDWRTMRYWFALLLCSLIIILLPTSGLFHHQITIIDPQITISTALFIFLMFYLKKHYQTITIKFLSYALLFITIFASFAKIYLGIKPSSAVIISLLLGLELALLFWILYRGLERPHNRSQKFVLFSTLCFILAVIIAHILNFHPLIKNNNKPKPDIFINYNTWWENGISYKYAQNRFGENLELLNLQYLGSIIKLRHILEKNLWLYKKQSFMHNILLRVSGKHDKNLKTQFYLNKKPIIILVRPISKPYKAKIILKIWHSRYKIMPYNNPLWVGNITVISNYHKAQAEALIKKYFLELFEDFNIKYQQRIYKLSEDDYSNF